MRESISLSWHIVVRNWRVYSKDFLANISPSLADPAFLLLSLGVGLGPHVSNLDGHSYLAFLAPGLAASSALFTAFFETSYGFYVKMTFESVIKAMLTTPIGVREILMGEMIWVFLKGAGMSTIVAIVLAAFGLFTYWPCLLLVPLIGGMIALACGAMGLIASASVRNINQFQTVYSFIISPLYFFSGIFFPLSAAPKWFLQIVQISPLFHGVRLMQMIFWNQFASPEPKNYFLEGLVHFLVLALYSAILIAISSRLVRRKLLN